MTYEDLRETQHDRRHLTNHSYDMLSSSFWNRHREEFATNTHVTHVLVSRALRMVQGTQRWRQCAKYVNSIEKSPILKNLPLV